MYVKTSQYKATKHYNTLTVCNFEKFLCFVQYNDKHFFFKECAVTYSSDLVWTNKFSWIFNYYSFLSIVIVFHLCYLSISWFGATFGYCISWWRWVNTLRPRQNGRGFADDTFKRIFVNENVRISIKISLKFVPKGPINNYPALVQIMAWRRSGDKPLSEPMMVSLLTHICVTRPQWVKGQYDWRCWWLWWWCWWWWC